MDIKDAVEEAIYKDTNSSLSITEKVSTAAKSLRYSMDYLRNVRKLKENIKGYASEVHFKPTFSHQNNLDIVKHTLPREMQEKVVDLLIEVAEGQVREKQKIHEAAKREALMGLQRITNNPEVDEVPF